MGMSVWDITVAIATAMQESSLRNLNYGDRDSLGLFQQRPSQGWGNPDQVRNPEYAAGQFFAALKRLGADRSSRYSLTRAAQAVQRSAYPNAYAKWEGMATALSGHATANMAPPGGGLATVNSAHVTGAPQYVAPVPGGTFTNDWGAARSGGRRHEGTDIFAPRHTPIQAITNGTIVGSFHSSLGGVTIRLQGDDGRRYYYTHLQAVAPGLRTGQRVTAGTIIGTVGNSGNAAGTPPHLHLGIYEGGKAVNPYPFLKNLPNGAGVTSDPSALAAATTYDADRLRGNYGYASGFYDLHPSLRALVDQATAQGWTPREFQARLQDTEWWRTHTDAQRKWQIIQNADPAEAADQKARKIEAIRALAVKLGVPASDGLLRQLAEDTLNLGLQDEEVQRLLANKQVVQAGLEYAGESGEIQEQLRGLAARFGLDISSLTVNNFVKNIVAGTDTMEGFRNYVQAMAKQLYPHLAGYIDQGMTMDDIAEPYRQLMGRVLEMDPGTVKLEEPTLKGALAHAGTDAKTGATTALMPLHEFERKLKNDPRWLKTTNARDNAMSVTTQVLRDFGLVTD